eukprot:CAMPEP_0177489516 /NCGR_PEP_ID=MMETSP0369-20130122/30743_1 /TAXON_ID=447022 ORGANISM="Scrippsiella hangoei-like, Strain SHHI-4" /NCGR_SAMPLE_ID=MMETSP0369 /ASSEMBLY_ACC=CAM_ASM_000364 /LENGTH=105 /DNA_ID=CAMNT_0018965981 /DNA_START=21 /DNA_END=335 /DNA_ORIENTATION=+
MWAHDVLCATYLALQTPPVAKITTNQSAAEAQPVKFSRPLPFVPISAVWSSHDNAEEASSLCSNTGRPELNDNADEAFRPGVVEDVVNGAIRARALESRKGLGAG